MQYLEIAPAPCLTPFVAAFWTLRGTSEEPSFDLVLPDGHAELVVHRTGRFLEWQQSGEIAEQPTALLAGVMERAIALSPARRFETVGVRFTPHGLAPLCRYPQSALSSRLTPARRRAVTGTRADRRRCGAGRLARGVAGDSADGTGPSVRPRRGRAESRSGGCAADRADGWHDLDGSAGPSHRRNLPMARAAVPGLRRHSAKALRARRAFPPRRQRAGRRAGSGGSRLRR